MTTPDNSTELDQRLSRLEAVFNTHRSETNTSFSELRGLTSELLEIAQLHQQALRQEQINQQRNDVPAGLRRNIALEKCAKTSSKFGNISLGNKTISPAVP